MNETHRMPKPHEIIKDGQTKELQVFKEVIGSLKTPKARKD